jgi:hypothetical protein
VASQSQELAAEVSRIQSEFARLEGEAQLSDIYNAIGDLDSRLVELPTTLDALRDRGYVHSAVLDDKLEALDDHWDELRPRVEAALQLQIRQLDLELDETERQVNQLRANAAAIQRTESAVTGLSARVSAAKNAVRGLYQAMELELSEVGAKIGVIRQMMDLIGESQQVRLLDAEGPLVAVRAVWQRDGKDGPEGILFLTDQRLLFEQRKEVVTKKLLGIFKTESEDKLSLMLDIQVSQIESVSHKEEGGFLGMGKDDILEFVFTAAAPVSRARFHLKGQDSADWAGTIKRIQTGEVDEDRADEYVEELAEAELAAASFPELCPNCFAVVPEVPRGVSSIACDFCGTVITPTTAAEEG